MDLEEPRDDLLSRIAHDPAVHRVLEPSVDDRLKNELAVSRAMSALSGGARGRPLRGVWLLAAAAVLVAGAAGAAYWRGLRAPPPAQSSDTTAQGAAIRPATETTTARGADLQAPAEPVDPAPNPDRSKARTLPAPEGRETPAQVFAEANDLRRTGSDSQAIATYRKVERMFPGSPEAEQSYATLGSLMMEHGSPQEALGQFDHYIGRGGPLLVDVLAGKASALQRLGRTADERRTWQTLLEQFPKSVHAARAKARLAELH